MQRFKCQAKTAYGVLQFIRRLILEEPKRYDQRIALAIEGADGLWDNHAPYEMPACGTVGCVAGWTTALLSPSPTRIVSPVNYARLKLGLTSSQVFELFDAGAATKMTNEYCYSQSRGHAEQGALLIQQFCQKYAKQLKAKKV